MTGRVIWTAQFTVGGGLVAYSPDGKTIATRDYYYQGEEYIALLDAKTGAESYYALFPMSGVRSLAFSSDGRYLACGAESIGLWDPQKRGLAKPLLKRGELLLPNNYVALSPDGSLMCWGEYGFSPESRALVVWDVEQWKERRRLPLKHSYPGYDLVLQVAFSPDGRYFSDGQTVWDVEAWQQVLSLGTEGTSVAFCGNGLLAAGTADGSVDLYDVNRRVQLQSVMGHDGPVLGLSFTWDGALLASTSQDGTTIVWDIARVLNPNEPPVAAFVWQALSSSGSRLVVEPRTGDRISFDASGSSDPDGKIAIYAWDWESDGMYDLSSSADTAERTFTSSGSHRVTLRVTDDKSATATVTQTISIGAPQPPQAGFSFAPGKPSILDEVKFTDASKDSDGQVKSWLWEFGDGTTSTERSPTHTYSRKGTFTVKLTVTDNDGLTGTKTLQLTVVNLPPEASFAFEPQAPVPGQTVRFSASASTDRDGTISAYAWDFDGDGKSDATGATATYAFSAEGDRAMTLVVTDSDGATARQQATITVAAAPPGPPRFAKQWGLVIGVAEYEDPAIADLQYTEADAQAFYDFLTDRTGGGFVKDNVRLLLNEQATSTAVKGGFSWLIQQAKKDDLVVIYFAGHGSIEADLDQPPDEADGFDEYLVTYDARASSLFATAVRDDEIGNWLAAFRCDHVVIILDSCYAAGGTRNLAREGTRAGPGNQVFSDMVGDGRLFLAASQESEVSYEDPVLGHGVFTYYLLRGLGALGDPKTLEADADKDGRVTVEELQTYLAREVSKERNQHPLVTGDLALARVALSGYGEPLVGEVTAIDGDRVSISLGSRQGVRVGDRFEVVHELLLPDRTTMMEVRAIIEVLYVLDPDRAVCRILESSFPIEVKDRVRPAP